MAKRKSPDFDALFKAEEQDDQSPPPESGFFDRFSGWYQKAFGIIKLIFGLCFLPFVYAFSTSFMHESALIERALQDYFWGGVIAFLLIYLFIWEPAIIYAKGHRVIEFIFTFFKPLVKFAPYLLPTYTILLFAFFGFFSLFINARWLIESMMFLVGFSTMLHLVFCAKTIRGKKSDFLKGNYIFGFSFVYVVNVSILGLCLNFIFKEFSFVRFFNIALQNAGSIFYAVFKQLFLN
ncbi:MAG: hypothetical protein KKC84_08050 [Candidatus Omnitrophica bacterium]|nr:hypothetical protein [Candidatus Omnitrophota bacterium]